MISRILFRIGLDRSRCDRKRSASLRSRRLGDLAIGRDNDFPGLGVYHIERNFFAEQNIRERIR